ncbi:RNA polymerase sigma factor [Mumia zhuanghuii]|uniref:RNA polymerase sigma factor n=2 Tax=Mumia TaxID=1546255 RepID=A0ABW1QN10_9ACTN|nr:MULTISPECIES: DUF6596 domain-containing protein [Mumia]KAA1420075.1 RNA polymerase sigma factor [Mumia zhuanghuii]
MAGEPLEDLLRSEAPQVLGAVVRRYGHFDLAEDAVQEALLAAAAQWPRDGVPDRPRAWLVTVAARRLTDLLRSEQARRRREDAFAAHALPDHQVGPPADARDDSADDTLVLLFLCCHPALSVASQIALTLRAVGGLTAAEVARAFLVPEATMTRRLTRAKRTVAVSGTPFALPPAAERTARLEAVLHVLYLVFTEGYAPTSGPAIARPDLAREAIRLTRVLVGLRSADPEVEGLLALMLLTHARRDARTGPDGVAVPMEFQDRARWDAAMIDEGTALVTAALGRPGGAGPYQLQAAIAALHDEAATPGDTDWPQILALYDLLAATTDSPVVALNHAVAVAMVHGPDAGLARLDALATDRRVAEGHRYLAARAHLLERRGDRDAARTAYEEAARRATALPQRRYLNAAALRLARSERPGM